MISRSTQPALYTGEPLTAELALEPTSAVSPQPRTGLLPLTESVVLGGFECSCHRLEDGRRLDMLGATRHPELAAEDYARLRSVGIAACREGIPWVRVEARRGEYDFSCVLPMTRAARRIGMQVIWDLMHFGWPDDVDVFHRSFPVRLGSYARAFARWLATEVDAPPIVTPINEMSFLAWAAGDVRIIHPFEAARGVELKAQLVRATIEAIEAIRSVWPRARFLQPEPVIRIHASPEQPKTWRRVESDNLLQYQAWDMLTGRVWPSLGGAPKYLDIVAVNYYPDNQFTIDGSTVERHDARYVRFRDLLMSVWERYRRPMLVSETGAEGEARAPWLRYVTSECVAAMRLGCELHGVTWYPIVNHPGWADGRHCHNGLWDYANAAGERDVDRQLLVELQRSHTLLRAARDEVVGRRGFDAPSATGA